MGLDRFLPAAHRTTPVRIELGPDRVRASFNRSGKELRQVLCAGPEAWPAALDELMAMLPSQGRLRVDVVVPAAVARLFVLPFSPALHSEARWLAYAGGRFEEIFGEGPAQWALRVVPERPQRPRLAAALPLGLMQVLRGRLGANLCTVRIDFLLNLDALRSREPRYSGALVDVRADHALVALMLNGTLQRIRLRRSAPCVDELGAALRIEWSSLGQPGALPALAVARGEVLDATEGHALGGLAQRVVWLA